MAEQFPAPDDRGLFVLYDYDQCALAATQVFGSYGEAAGAIDSRLQNVLVLRLPLDAGPAEADEDEVCVCQKPGEFCSGVPGILAHVVGGKLVNGTKVERCDVCERYLSDEAALEKLRELGIVPDDYRDFLRCAQSTSGEHAADPASAKAVAGAEGNGGADWCLEFRCRYCGQLGSMRVNPARVVWD